MSKNPKPQISRIVNFENGEAIQLFGENFGRENKVYWWRPQTGETVKTEDYGLPGAELPEFPPDGATVYKITTFVDSQVIFVGGDQGTREGTAVMWVENENGISKPFVANAPDIWMQTFKKVYPGAVASFYGIGFWSVQHRKAVFKNKATGEFKDTEFLSPFMYYYPHDSHRNSMHIRIPESLENGEYEVYLHSGYGGLYGWSKPVTVTVDSEYTLTEYYRTKWNRETADEIMLPPCRTAVIPAPAEGAFKDMTDEIQTALDGLYANGGGVLILTAGVYGISDTLTLRDGVILQGAGKGATTVRTVYGKRIETDWLKMGFAYKKSGVSGWAKDWQKIWATRKNGALIRICGDAGVEGLRLEMGGADIGILVSAQEDNAEVFGAFANYVEVDGGANNTYDPNAEFGSISAAFLTTCSNTELTVYKCKFTALVPIWVMPAANYRLRIIKNTFECSPRQMDQTYFSGVHDSVFIENDFISGRRALMSQQGFESNWVYQNRVYDVARNCNALELYMCENGSCDWTGTADEIGDDHIVIGKTEDDVSEDFVLSAEANRENSRFVCIIDGTGFGQYRKVIGVDGKRLILDTPWTVKPDYDTVFTVVCATYHNMWVDNNTASSNGHTQFIWLCGIENVMSGHIIELSAGIRLYSHLYNNEKMRTCVVAFNYILHCQIKGSGKGMWLDVNKNYIDCKDDRIKRTLGMFGNSVRQNLFDGMHSITCTKNLPEFVDLTPHCGVAISGSYNSIVSNRIGGYTTAVEMLTKGVNYMEKNIFTEDSIRIGGYAESAIGPDSKVKE